VANMVIMPKLGATMDVGRIIRWFISEGDNVVKGAPLLEVESDKATLEVESPFDGTLLKILHPDGDIPVLQPIGIIGTPGEDISGLIGSDDTARTPAAPAEENCTETLQAVKPGMEPEKCGVRSTPAAKYAAKINNVDLAQITPNENGIITGKEVEEYLKTATIRATPLAARIAEINNISLGDVEHEGKKICKADVLSHIDMRDRDNQTHTGMQTGLGINTGMNAQNAPRIRTMGNIRRKVAEKVRTAVFIKAPGQVVY
jgi:pyruvate dehydrogenase E2 component (dihydrolipoamide acetyltransferase)